MSQIFEQQLTHSSQGSLHKNDCLQYSGLTLKEYFERSEEANKLNKIQEEQESESELEYKNGGGEQKKTNRTLKSLTKLKSYEFDLERTMINKHKPPQIVSPNRKISFNADQIQHHNKLPSIHHQSFSPQVKNLKLQIMSKFRQHYRTKTEAQEVISNKISMKKRNNQSLLVHITKKKGTSIYQKMLTNSNRNEEVEKEADGFRLTFSKIPERKQSEFSMINSIRKTKRY